jgi:hypothetical protein
MSDYRPNFVLVYPGTPSPRKPLAPRLSESVNERQTSRDSRDSYTQPIRSPAADPPWYFVPRK